MVLEGGDDAVVGEQGRELEGRVGEVGVEGRGGRLLLGLEDLPEG